MSQTDVIQVEIVFGLPERQELVSLLVSRGTSCADAINQSGIAAAFPNVDLDACPIAIWGRPVEKGTQARDGDRIEILRPLDIDPRAARRQLAEAGQFMGSSGTDVNSS